MPFHAIVTAIAKLILEIVPLDVIIPEQIVRRLHVETTNKNVLECIVDIVVSEDLNQDACDEDNSNGDTQDGGAHITATPSHESEISCVVPLWRGRCVCREQRQLADIRALKDACV